MKTVFSISSVNAVSLGMLAYARHHRDSVLIKAPIELSHMCLGLNCDETLTPTFSDQNPFPVVDDYVPLHDLNLRKLYGIPSNAYVVGLSGVGAGLHSYIVKNKDVYMITVDATVKYTHERVMHANTPTNHHTICSLMNTFDVFVHDSDALTLHLSRACEHSLPVYTKNAVVRQMYGNCLDDLDEGRKGATRATLSSTLSLNPFRELVHPKKVTLDK